MAKNTKNSRKTKVSNVEDENTTINIMGTDWVILYKDEDEDPCFAVATGYCNECKKQIVLKNPSLDLSEPTDMDLESKELDLKRVLRHEIVHAFLYESGLGESSVEATAWAINEEMVDWFARVSPKIFKIYNELGIM